LAFADDCSAGGIVGRNGFSSCSFSDVVLLLAERA
jgi:hypothetical protein